MMRMLLSSSTWLMIDEEGEVERESWRELILHVEAGLYYIVVCEVRS